MKTKHIIAIGLLSALTVGLLGFAIHTEKAKTYEAKAETQPTTLVNSTWQIKDTPTLENFNYFVNFTTNNQNYTIFLCNNILSTIQYNTTLVYNNNNWVNTNYKTIKFTGGTHIANNNLRIWLSNNATLISYDPNNNIYNTGYTEGQTIGYTEGYNTGHDTGYSEGVAFGYDATALENPVDFAPMMLNILTMPFTFISQAFNVTLWPNTQYQINIGNFIKAMLAISAILFIIKLFTSGFSILGNYTNNYQNNKLTKEKRKLVKAQTDLANRTDPNKKTIRKE